MSDPGFICDGCRVRSPWEHRCHGSDGAWMGNPTCTCDCTAAVPEGTP